MNAYDFDNTIYDGESIIDFFMFLLKKDKGLFLHLPKVLLRLIEYKLNIVSSEKIYKTVEEITNKFLSKHMNEIDLLVSEFWDKNHKRLKPSFLNMLKEDDLIITGCPRFLIEYVKDDIKAKNIICTEFNFETNKIEFLCLGKNKVEAYNKKYKGNKIEKFYTDSLVDIPFMKCSEEVYLVKKNKITKIDKKKYIK